LIYIEYFPYCLFVSNSQVIGCEDRLQSNLYCVGWDVKLCSINPILKLKCSRVIEGTVRSVFSPIAALLVPVASQCQSEEKHEELLV